MDKESKEALKRTVLDVRDQLLHLSKGLDASTRETRSKDQRGLQHEARRLKYDTGMSVSIVILIMH